MDPTDPTHQHQTIIPRGREAERWRETTPLHGAGQGEPNRSFRPGRGPGSDPGRQIPVATTRGPKEFQRCVQDCSDCHDMCRGTVSHCLEKGGDHARPDHIWRMLDCASLCHATSQFVTHHSDHHQAVCAACAEVCEACADDCATFGDDQHMKSCAEACRRCAESCRMMATL